MGGYSVRSTHVLIQYAFRSDSHMSQWLSEFLRKYGTLRENVPSVSNCVSLQTSGQLKFEINTCPCDVT